MSSDILQQLSDEISLLQYQIIELKEKRARLSEYPPIKLTENESTLNLLTDHKNPWSFINIKKLTDKTYSATILCDACFTYDVKAKLYVNKQLEVLEIYVDVKPSDKFIWNASKEAYSRYFYDGLFDNDKEVLIKFKKV